MTRKNFSGIDQRHYIKILACQLLKEERRPSIMYALRLHLLKQAVLEELEYVQARGKAERLDAGRKRGGKNKWKSRLDDPIFKTICDRIEVLHAAGKTERQINGALKREFSAEGKPGFRKYSPSTLRQCTAIGLKWAAQQKSVR